MFKVWIRPHNTIHAKYHFMSLYLYFLTWELVPLFEPYSTMRYFLNHILLHLLGWDLWDTFLSISKFINDFEHLEILIQVCISSLDMQIATINPEFTMWWLPSHETQIWESSNFTMWEFPLFYWIFLTSTRCSSPCNLIPDPILCDTSSHC